MKAQCEASGEPVLPLTEWIAGQAGSEPVTLQQYSIVSLINNVHRVTR